MAEACTCEKCVAACRHVPGSFTPWEALAAIRAGHALDMMLVDERDHAVRDDKIRRHQFAALYPRSIIDPEAFRWDRSGGEHFRSCGWDALGVCVFLTDGGRCRLHDSGFKPAECRHTRVCESRHCPDSVHILPWDTFVGRAVIEIWKKELAKEQRR